MKNSNKTHRIIVRVSDKELEELKEKSKNYPTLSSFVLDACFKFDDELGIKRLERLRLWSEDFHSFKTEISKIGANINQLAHYVNNLQKTGVFLPSVLDEIVRVENEFNLMMNLILKSNMNFKKTAKHLLHK